MVEGEEEPKVPGESSHQRHKNPRLENPETEAAPVFVKAPEATVAEEGQLDQCFEKFKSILRQNFLIFMEFSMDSIRELKRENKIGCK